MSDSLRLFDFPGKSTGVGCHFLLQGIFPTQGSNPGLPHCRQTLYPLSHQGSPHHSSFLFQTRFLFVPLFPPLYIHSLLIMYCLIMNNWNKKNAIIWNAHWCEHWDVTQCLCMSFYIHTELPFRATKSYSPLNISHKILFKRLKIPIAYKISSLIYIQNKVNKT